MSEAMGLPFGNPELFQPFGPDSAGSCFWSAPFSTVEIFLADGAESVEQLRNAASDPSAVGGFGDVAIYDLVTGNALNPSGIETDGQMQYNNFVNLHVVIDDNTTATIHVQGNLVIEAGPETGLLDRLRALVEALRESL